MMKHFNIQNRVGCSALMREGIHSQSPALAFFRLAKQIMVRTGYTAPAGNYISINNFKTIQV
jgi:hypothetical protein